MQRHIVIKKDALRLATTRVSVYKCDVVGFIPLPASPTSYLDYPVRNRYVVFEQLPQAQTRHSK